MIRKFSPSLQGCNNHKHTKIEGYDFVTKQLAPLITHAPKYGQIILNGMKTLPVSLAQLPQAV